MAPAMGELVPERATPECRVFYQIPRDTGTMDQEFRRRRPKTLRFDE